MTAIGKLVRTTAFKLSMAYLVVFIVFAFGTLAYVAWSARRVLDDQFVSTIEAEISGLSEQYRAGGLRRLVNIVDRRSRTPGALSTSSPRMRGSGSRAISEPCRRAFSTNPGNSKPPMAAPTTPRRRRIARSSAFSS